MKYLLHHQGRNLGRFSREELKAMRNEGRLTGREMVWTDKMVVWERLDQLSELRSDNPARSPTVPGNDGD